MNVSKRLLFAATLVVFGSMVGCSHDPVTPRADMFIGQVGGCGNFFAYRFNNDRTMAITVSVDETSIDLLNGPVSIDIDSTIGGVSVRVVQFKAPAGAYFCDDVGGDPEPSAEWIGLIGTMTIERSTAEPPQVYANGTHNVSLKLTAIQVKNMKTGAITTLDEVLMDNVQVGWLPG